MNIIIRLEFDDVFPNEEVPKILDLLAKVSKKSLLNVIGFCNTRKLPNYNNFFSNPNQQLDVNRRVSSSFKNNTLINNVGLISSYGSLKLAEIILCNLEELPKKFISVDEDELNLFKAFLLINTGLNNIFQNVDLKGNNFEKLIDCSIIFKFSESDIGIYDNINTELIKVVYTTYYKIEKLLSFIESNKIVNCLLVEYLKSFNVISKEEFLKQVKLLFGGLIISRHNNSYKFEVNDADSLAFLTSIALIDTTDNVLDEDFTFLKNKPIYFIDENNFSITNYFFVIDKFYKSAKFKLKELYSITGLHRTGGDFFGFFNNHFSENVLMKDVLDEIFEKSYFKKKEEAEREIDGEADYYLRYNNNVFIFENKDSMVSARVKASGDINEIDKMLESKFLMDNGRSVGIGQLVNTIDKIINKEFELDDYVNSKNKLEVFPILLIHDRIFQCPGINYKLNKWYQTEVRNRIGDNYRTKGIQNLVVIDIDTLIVLIPFLKNNFKLFKDILKSHLRDMNISTTPQKCRSEEEASRRILTLLDNIMCSISHRRNVQKMDFRHFINMFSDVVSN